jgi:hypothetical protein
VDRKFFQLNLIPKKNPDYCFVNERPEGMGLHDYRLGNGEPATQYYPPDARIYMEDEEPGTELPSFIGNTAAMLLVDRALKEAVAKVCGTEHYEYLPVSIYDHKKRLASDQYFIINPLGSFDCANDKESHIVYQGTEVLIVRKLVLDAKKMEKAPHLFRLKQWPSRYIIDSVLAAALVEMDPRPTNVYFTELSMV